MSKNPTSKYFIHFYLIVLFSTDILSHTVTWETTNRATQQWISITSAYTLCINTSSPCGLCPPAAPSLHFGSLSFLGAPSVFVGSSSQTGSSSGLRKMESSVWERVELLSRRVMIPLLNEGIWHVFLLCFWHLLCVCHVHQLKSNKRDLRVCDPRMPKKK